MVQGDANEFRVVHWGVKLCEVVLGGARWCGQCWIIWDGTEFCGLVKVLRVVLNGVRWCAVVEMMLDIARWCGMVLGGATWCEKFTR